MLLSLWWLCFRGLSDFLYSLFRLFVDILQFYMRLSLNNLLQSKNKQLKQMKSLLRFCCTQTTSSSVSMHMCNYSVQTMFISHSVPNTLKVWELRFHCPPQNWKAHQEIILEAATMPAMCHCNLIFQAFCPLLLLSVPWGRQLSTHSSYSSGREKGSRDHSF